MKTQQSLSKYLSRTPKRINDDAWYYHEPKGITVVHKHEQLTISWRQIEAAVKNLNLAKQRAKAKVSPTTNKER